MAHFYYVWKDPTCEGINTQWQQMNGRKFYEFLQNEGKDRYFITMDDGADQGMDIITMETTREKYLEWDKEKARKYRLKKSQELCAPTMISMDALVGDDKELTYHDIIADDSVDVEAEVAENFMLERLREAVADLPAEDLEILDALFFNNDEELSDRQISPPQSFALWYPVARIRCSEEGFSFYHENNFWPCFRRLRTAMSQKLLFFHQKYQIFSSTLKRPPLRDLRLTTRFVLFHKKTCRLARNTC